jgi:uncharacterized repeat protein (TIGR01451 family)
MYPQLKNTVAVLAAAAVLAVSPALAQTADLSLAITKTPKALADGGVKAYIGAIGSTGKYVYSVSNAGPDTATDVTVATALPDTVEVTKIVSALADGGAVATWTPTDTGWESALEDGGTLEVTGTPVVFPSLAASESGTVTFSVAWAPSKLPTTCNTHLDLTATAGSAVTDPASDNNAVTLSGVTVPIADLTATLEFADPKTLRLPASNVEFTGTVTNAGPCAVPAGELTLDASLDDTASFGVIFVSGAGACTEWNVAGGDSADGVCSVPADVAAGSTISFTFIEKIADLADSDNGGQNIIQSASDVSFNADYDGNPLLVDGDNTSPVVTVLVKGPGTACSMTGGPLSVLALLGYGVMARRRKSKR